MLIDDYFGEIERIISERKTISLREVIYDKRSDFMGKIKGAITFINGTKLNFIEFVEIRGISVKKFKYSYHYSGKTTFRYDNSPHYKNMETFPNHKHIGNEVLQSKEVSLLEVIKEIEDILINKNL